LMPRIPSMHPDDLTRRWFLACLTASGGAGLLTVSHSSVPLAKDTQLARDSLLSRR